MGFLSKSSKHLQENKSQISSTKLQIKLKIQYSMTKTFTAIDSQTLVCQ
ncbi:hypothetical protein D1BOALGB6SA_5874 [Olavius sp. associated proteobacterium Delta 1]|nr:hypothetical protein D1BOALGB6SA_5874 [Olavius sp. associated proteobacterium Delta 1]